MVNAGASVDLGNASRYSCVITSFNAASMDWYQILPTSYSAMSSPNPSELKAKKPVSALGYPKVSGEESTLSTYPP
jgi:hypothetical protein